MLGLKVISPVCNGSSNEAERVKIPELKLVRELPPLNPRAIEKAVRHFISEVDVKGDKGGFFNQTLKSIASATLFKVPGCDFWMAEEDGDVMGYALVRVVQDIDDSLTYWISQGWCHPKYRNGIELKKSWVKLEEQAKKYMCKHIVNVTNRNPEAYLRVLGNGWEEYSTILKKEL